MSEPTNEETQNRCAKYEGLAIAGGALLLFGVGIGLRGFWFPDEPDVAQPTIEMMRRADWITPTHNGVPWIDYPPLVYWLGHFFSLITGGISHAALRLPSVLAGAALVWGTWAAGRRWFGPSVGRLAALLLATFPIFAWQAMNVHPDMCFAAGQALGILAYIRGDEERGGRRLAWWAGAFVLFGAAWLSKGPLGLLLPGMVLTLWQLSRGHWRRWLAMAPLALIAVMVALPWYVALIAEQGRQWVMDEIYAQNFARYGAGDRGHAQPPFYYLEVIWAGIAPLGLALPWAIFGDGFRRCRRDPRQRALWIWLVSCFVFFSLAVTKREVYLLPTYPAMALLVAICYENWRRQREEGKAHWAEALVAGMTGGVLGLLALFFTIPVVAPQVMAARLPAEQGHILEALRPGLALLVLATAIGSWGAWLRVFRKAKAGRWREWVIAGLVLSLIVIQVTVLPVVDRVRSYGPLVAWMEARLPAGAPLAIYGKDWTRNKRCGFLNHLSPDRKVLELHSERDLQAFQAAYPHLPLITGSQELESLLRESPELADRVGPRWHLGSRPYIALLGTPEQTPEGE